MSPTPILTLILIAVMAVGGYSLFGLAGAIGWPVGFYFLVAIIIITQRLARKLQP